MIKFLLWFSVRDEKNIFINKMLNFWARANIHSIRGISNISSRPWANYFLPFFLACNFSIFVCNNSVFKLSLCRESSSSNSVYSFGYSLSESCICIIKFFALSSILWNLSSLNSNVKDISSFSFGRNNLSLFFWGSWHTLWNISLVVEEVFTFSNI